MWYNILQKGGKSMAKKKKKPTKKPKYGEILITALVDLIVGTLLILVDKAIK